MWRGREGGGDREREGGKEREKTGERESVREGRVRDGEKGGRDGGGKMWEEIRRMCVLIDGGSDEGQWM